MKGKCDICGHKDGWMLFRMRKCTECGLLVHENCYALLQTSGPIPEGWKCHACAAVGKAISVKGIHAPERSMVQASRPSDCALCPVQGGVHAMSPLYDTHGPEGRQRLLSADPSRDLPARPGWVHSLCALGIAAMTGGSVFGCLADGSWGEEEIAEEDMEGGGSRPQSKEGGKSPKRGGGDIEAEDEDDNVGELHHFVISEKRYGKEDDDYSRVISRHRKELKCFLCGNHGCPPTHVPVQCCAHHENEFEEYRERYHEPDMPCTTALHIGCVKWTNTRAYSRAHYYPGHQVGLDEEKDDYKDAVVGFYCDLHAEEIWKNRPGGKRAMLPRRSGGKNAGGRNPSAQSQFSKARKKAKARSDEALRPNPPLKANNWYAEIKDDLIGIIERALARKADPKVATKRCKDHWQNQTAGTGMSKKDFLKMWKDVEDDVKSMPFNMEAVEATPSSIQQVDEQTKNSWAYLWEGEKVAFEFGDWDTQEILGD
jgi:hypothetical protein